MMKRRTQNAANYTPLVEALTKKCFKTKCVLIPKSLDGRIQVTCQKYPLKCYFPRIFRLKPVFYPFNGMTHDIVIVWVIYYESWLMSNSTSALEKVENESKSYNFGAPATGIDRSTLSHYGHLYPPACFVSNRSVHCSLISLGER